jgi:hypothetical protein
MSLYFAVQNKIAGNFGLFPTNGIFRRDLWNLKAFLLENRGSGGEETWSGRRECAHRGFALRYGIPFLLTHWRTNGRFDPMAC